MILKEIGLHCQWELANQYFLSDGHSIPEVMIFIGEGIKLIDLKNIYYRLAMVGQFRAWLGTKREGIFDTHIFKDKIE